MSQPPDVAEQAIAESAAEMNAADDVDAAELKDAFATVQDTLEWLSDVDATALDAETAEQIRTSLPTDPVTAELLSAALRGTPLGDVLEYVSPSDRQDGYWRRSRERSDPAALSNAELRQRYAFLQSARESCGLEGTTPTPDGRQIPKTAAAVGENLANTEFHHPDDDPPASVLDRGRDIVRRLRSALP